MFTEILKNHQISRNICNDDSVLSPNADTTAIESPKVRNIHDVLGPLPAIPTTSGEQCSRWSMRRASGYSGIYEEILDAVDGQ